MTLSFYNMVKAVFYTVLQVINTATSLLLSTPFIIVLLLIFCIGVRICRRVSFPTTFWLVLPFLAFFWPFVCAYPLRLAYCVSIYATYLPNRCEFVETTVLVFTCCICALSIGICAGRKTGGTCVRYALLCTAMITFFGFEMNSAWNPVSSVLYNSCMEFVKGTYKAYSSQVWEIYDFIGDSEENDVVVTSPGSVAYFPSFYISDDVSSWLNGAIARYYGKNSVRCETQ